jgi:hypothetical protein
MLRNFIAILLPATLLLLAPAPPPVNGQPARTLTNPQRFPGIAGQYVNDNGGGECSVSPRGDGFLFVNERGSRAIFGWAGPRRLRVIRIIDGWDPNISATVTQDGLGRTVIRFYAPYTPPGSWTRVS